MILVVASVAASVPAHASRFGPGGWPQFPSFPYSVRAGSGAPPLFVQDAVDPNKWVWTLDPTVYGATGTVTFYNYANAITQQGTMSGPGGASVNDWQICNDPLETCPADGSPAFRFDRPSFTQSVESVPADFLTQDPPSTIASDWDLSTFQPDSSPLPRLSTPYTNANMDGSANLFRFAYTIAPGTQFMNMQIDKSGNYYVSRRDMQWQFIDKFTYKSGNAPVQSIDTQFTIQPYPISDAYGWCGAVPASDPNALETMAGQLTKDIAFDVWNSHGNPGVDQRPFATEVVPSFQMRSYGRYVMDVTMLSTGTRQQFSAVAKGVHIRPVAVTINNVTYPAGSRVQPGDPDFYRWLNRVSPFAAGVVPIGAWVIFDGTPYMQVVPAGTSGAVWHTNVFAGAAYLVRGDMERTLNYVNAADPAIAGDQGTRTGSEEVYANLIASNATNAKTNAPWKRADWTDWATDGVSVLPDAY